MDMTKERVIVIGAGIVGVSTALHLQRRGLPVALIDRAAPGEATSSGNAGVISPSAMVPVQGPGLLAQTPALLRDPDGPLSLDLLYVLRRAKWFAAYLRHGKAAAARRISAALAGLTQNAVGEHLALAQNTAAARWIKKSDYLYIYPNRAQFESEAFSFQIRAAHGVRWREIDDGELRRLEPDLSPEFRFAVCLPDHGFSLCPTRLVKGLAELFAANGGEIIRAEVRSVHPQKREIATSIAPLTYRSLVIAAGPWSGELAAQAGVRAPLISERGYHVFFREPAVRHNHPLKVSAGKYVATPMAQGLRLAGIVEFKCPDAPPEPRVIARLRRHARRLFPSARLDDAGEWFGRRPALPDSLPLIGRAPRYPDIFLAFGHHHIGLTTGPKTGRLIAQLAAGDTPAINLAPFSPARFGGD